MSHPDKQELINGLQDGKELTITEPNQSQRGNMRTRVWYDKEEKRYYQYSTWVNGADQSPSQISDIEDFLTSKWKNIFPIHPLDFDYRE